MSVRPSDFRLHETTGRRQPSRPRKHREDSERHSSREGYGRRSVRLMNTTATYETHPRCTGRTNVVYHYTVLTRSIVDGSLRWSIEHSFKYRRFRPKRKTPVSTQKQTSVKASGSQRSQTLITQWCKKVSACRHTTPSPHVTFPSPEPSVRLETNLGFEWRIIDTLKPVY